MARLLVTTTTGHDREKLRAAFQRAGHEVDLAPDVHGLLAAVQPEPADGEDRARDGEAGGRPFQGHGPYDVVFLDVAHTLEDPLDVVNFLRQSSPATDIIVMAEVAELSQAAALIRRGATLYLVEPVEPAEALSVVESALRRQKNALVVRAVDTRSVDNFFGSTPAMAKLYRLIRKVAPTDATVLITGESGTGKEVVANIIHRLSPRAQYGKMVPVNCGAIPDTLLESELFGHAKGAFTGAVGEKVGLFQEADKGTCFLDEIADMPQVLQVKLLRFLQDRMVRRVGGNKSEKVDVRVLAATNRNLVVEMAAGRFREDLFFRLNVVQIYLPPLRERRDTIPFLVGTFLSRFVRQYKKSITSIDPAAQAILMAYAYPGNIRELENVIEYACIMAEGNSLEESDLPPQVRAGRGEFVLPPGTGSGDTLVGGTSAVDGHPLTLAEMESAHIKATLDRCGGNQTLAAKMLGISRTSLWRKVKDGK